MRRFKLFLKKARDLFVRVVGPLLDRPIEPLPAWTNRPLAALMVMIWLFVIGLNWWGDSKVFVTIGLLVIGGLFVAIFAREAAEDKS